KGSLLIFSLAFAPLPAFAQSSGIGTDTNATPACDAHKAKTRLVPVLKDGEAHGLKVFAIQPDSVYERAGFKNGDVFLAIDDTKVTEPSPDPLERAAKAANKGAIIALSIERQGKRHSLRLAL